jgi:predicted outer membrane repeat protein
LVGQGRATINGGADPGIAVTAGDLNVRDVDVVQGSNTGVVATSGANLRMERCRVQRNSAGGIFIDGAGFTLNNVLLEDNGAGDDGGAIYVGLRVKNVPSTAAKTVTRTSVLGPASTAVSCAQRIDAQGLLVTGAAMVPIAPTCGVSSCGTMSATCGSDLQP